MIKNDLILKALKGKPVNRPPVWVMRQAGRYLPEFRKLREKYDFFTRCQTPELATEITLQPITRFQPDAAIIFSDILVIPKAMGQQVEMKPNIGPWLPKPISSESDINQLSIPNIEEQLGYVLEAIKLTKHELNNNIPLIGFAGTPWTLLCYMIEGQGSKTFDKPKAFCFQNPKLAKIILDKITKTTIAYLLEKIKAGCNIIQLFDSWGGILSPKDYQEIALPYNLKIIKAIAPHAPVIFFGKGCWFAMEHYKNVGLSGLAIDWTCPISYARKITQNELTLQGNLDPSILLSSKTKIQKETKNMIDTFGKQRYIANLGHGILPNVPVDHAKTFIDTVKNYS